VSTVAFVAGCLIAFVVGVALGSAWRAKARSPRLTIGEADVAAGSPRYIVILRDPLPAGTIFECPAEELEAEATFRKRWREAYERGLTEAPRYFVGRIDVERELRIVAEVQGELAAQKQPGAPATNH
jgi:hypothetical protein